MSEIGKNLHMFCSYQTFVREDVVNFEEVLKEFNEKYKDDKIDVLHFHYLSKYLLIY